MSQYDEWGPAKEEDLLLHKESLEDEVDAIGPSSKKGLDGNASLLSSSFNMANSAIGAGVLAFPYAFYKAGLVAGVLVAVVQLVICGFTMQWLVKEADRKIPGKPAQPYSYEMLIDRRFGKWMGFIAVLALLANVLGAMVGFLIIIGDMGEPIALQLFGEVWYSNRAFVTFVLILLLVAPFSALPRIDLLKFTSILSIFSISFVVLMVTVTSVISMVNGDNSDDVVLVSFSWGFFTAVPIITFALTCHMQAVPVYRELERASVSRFSAVVIVTYSICAVLYIGNGSFGYLEFRNEVSDNILNNYSNDDVVANIARVCVVITAMFSYPLMNFVYRTALDYVLFDFGNTHILMLLGKHVPGPPPVRVDEDSDDLEASLNFDQGLRPLAEPTYARLLVETYVTLVLCWIVSILVPSIGVVFGLIGASAGAVIVFILPAALEFNGAETKATKYFAGFVFVFGVFIGIIGTAVTIIDIL